MLSMNGIIACELLLGVVALGLIFTSFADTDLIADGSPKSENETEAGGCRTATKQTDLSTHVHENCSPRLSGEEHGWGFVASGKKPSC
jgi:hypothetical protein